MENAPENQVQNEQNENNVQENATQKKSVVKTIWKYAKPIVLMGLGFAAGVAYHKSVSTKCTVATQEKKNNNKPHQPQQKPNNKPAGELKQKPVGGVDEVK